MRALRYIVALSGIALSGVVFVAGCNSPTSSSPDSPGGSVTEIPFSFHKPNVGATFTMHSVWLSTSGAAVEDTTFLFTVRNADTTIFGKTGAVRVDGYYTQPFFVHYRPSGDIELLGSWDFIFSHRNTWNWYPLALPAGSSTQTFTHDSLISNPDPNDTRAVYRDTCTVLGKETLTIHGQSIDCIKLRLRSTYTLTSIPYGFTINSPFEVIYWYAPTLGFWAKEEYSGAGFGSVTVTLSDFSL